MRERIERELLNEFIESELARLAQALPAQPADDGPPIVELDGLFRALVRSHPLGQRD